MSANLHALGWKPFYQQQLSDPGMEELIRARVGSHFGNRILCLTETGEFSVPIGLTDQCGDIAVGDWLLLAPETHRAVRRLERNSLIFRKAAGEKVKSQLIAANVDTLFIVSSCNHDFNPARIERYLALALEAGVHPVIVLTRADVCEAPHALRQQAESLKSGLIVETIDARDATQADVLTAWCGPGQTVALVGSSGVGKSTLAMTLGAGQLSTQKIREDDSKGRHTTTAKSIYRLDAGGLLIDTPGMRELQLADCDEGLAEVFDDILVLAEFCRFRDCSHEGEPGCAVQAAIERDEIDRRRLTSYRKLQSEQARNAKALHERRYESRKRGQFYKSVQASKRALRNRDNS